MFIVLLKKELLIIKPSVFEFVQKLRRERHSKDSEI